MAESNIILDEVIPFAATIEDGNGVIWDSVHHTEVYVILTNEDFLQVKFADSPY